MTSETNPKRPGGKRERRRTEAEKKRLVRRRILIAAIVILAVVVGLVIAYNAMFRRPEVGGEGLEPGEEELTGTQPKVSGKRKTDDFYTFLLMGRDTGGGGNTDTMMLISYNVTDQEMNVMSLPRDTMVNVPWDIKKLNSVYNYYGGGDKGIAAIKEEVSDLVGFVPDYEIVVEWEAVGKLVEAIGGVYFDVPFDMDYEDPTQDLYIHLKAGYQKLNGEQAMGLIRWRHNNSYSVQYPNGDLGRIQTQQEFMKAVIEQTLQLENAGKIMEFAKIFSENVSTDLSVQNLFWLGKEAILGGLTMDNVNFITMPCKGASVWSRTVHNYQSYVVPMVDELLEVVNESFNPFVEEVTENEIDVMIVNSDGSLSATSGKVEDTKAATSTKPAVTDNGSGSSNGNSSNSGGNTSSSPSVSPSPSPSHSNSGGSTVTEEPTHSGTTSQPPEESTPVTSSPSEEPSTSPSTPVESPPAANDSAPEQSAASDGGTAASAAVTAAAAE